MSQPAPFSRPTGPAATGVPPSRPSAGVPVPAPSPLLVFWRRHGGRTIGVALVALLAAGVWYLLSDTAAKRREVAAPPTLMLPPPPPPPPEPEKLPEPDPIKPEVVPPEPTPVEPLEAPVENAPPNPSQDLGDPVTIDGAAQAGTDGFGVSAGRGGGMAGAGRGGLASGSYGRYVSSVLQQAVTRDARTRTLAYQDVRLLLWLDEQGRPTRVELARGCGNAATDEALLAVVRGMDGIGEKPPAGLSFPIRLTVTGRRPG
ncbi:energy transducer TonB family protein [Roseateles chitosanitabidus]|uniref:energy transducer TonB family protein n=1 Tax=Roseateles chitosanitabidus TaxID=65048 RepID=UPI0023577EC3|nr:energy transducer TonB [Roseateles chitosanitabidus]